MDYRDIGKTLNAATGMELKLVSEPRPGLMEAVDMPTSRSVLIAIDEGESTDETFGKMMSYAGAFEARRRVYRTDECDHEFRSVFIVAEIDQRKRG